MSSSRMQSSTRIGWVTLLGCTAALAWACTRLDPSHCGNRSGDATCRAQSDERPFCDLCEPYGEGCVAEPPTGAECRPPEEELGTETTASTTAVSDGTGTETGDEPEPPTTESGASEAGDAPDTETDPATETGAETETETETDGEPFCGNGKREGDEECDGEDFGGETCASQHDDDPHWRGMLVCNAECEIRTFACCRSPGASCTVLSASDCCSGTCVEDDLLDWVCGLEE